MSATEYGKALQNSAFADEVNRLAKLVKEFDLRWNQR
jgi:hypothetical protein